MKASRFFDTLGDGASDFEGVGNFLDAGDGAKILKFKPLATERYYLHYIMSLVEGQGTASPTSYGGIAAGVVTNGVKVEWHNTDGLVWDITGRSPIKDNASYLALSHRSKIFEKVQSDNSASYYYYFTEEGSPLLLDGAKGDEFRIILNDDFSGLDRHIFRAGAEYAWKI